MAFWLFGLVQGLGICMGGTSLIGFKDPRLYGLELLKGDCRSCSNGYSRKKKACYTGLRSGVQGLGLL